MSVIMKAQRRCPDERFRMKTVSMFAFFMSVPWEKDAADDATKIGRFRSRKSCCVDALKDRRFRGAKIRPRA